MSATRRRRQMQTPVADGTRELALVSKEKTSIALTGVVANTLTGLVVYPFFFCMATMAIPVGLIKLNFLVLKAFSKFLMVRANTAFRIANWLFNVCKSVCCIPLNIIVWVADNTSSKFSAHLSSMFDKLEKFMRVN